MVLASSSSLDAYMLEVEADSIQRDRSRIEAAGNVVVTGRGMVLNADRVVYDTETEDILASGSCTLQDQSVEVKADWISYNARTLDLKMGDGALESTDGTMRLKGRTIERFETDHIRATSVEFTPCMGDPPDWSLAIGDLDIPIGGYGQGRDVRFMVRQHTLFRLPWFFFPAKFYRHSGVLLPEMGYGSDYGYRFGLPVYLVLSDSVDVTFTPTYLSDRGFLEKSEMRYSLDRDNSGFLYLESLSDRKRHEDYRGSVEGAVPDGRWFFKAVQEGGALKWDLNLVSTPDYFRDIGTFIDRNPLQKAHAPDDLNRLDDSRLEDLVSRAQWTGDIKGLSWSLSALNRQDLTVEDNGHTLQELPRATVRLAQQRIPSTPLMASAGFGTVRLVSDDWVDAVKDNAWAELTMPVGIQPYFTFTPLVREYYRDTRFTNEADRKGDSRYAERWLERGASLTTALYSPVLAYGLQHQMVPGVSWLYRSRHGGGGVEGDADPYPELLPEDRLEKADDIEVSLANYLRDSGGASIADLSVKSTYARLDSRWRDMVVDLNFNLSPSVGLSHRNVMENMEGSGFASTEHTTTLHVADPRGDVFSIGYEYRRAYSKLLTSSAEILLARSLSLTLNARYDNTRNRFEEHSQELVYTSQCWAVSLERKVDASEEDDSRSRATWTFNVKLLGVGDVPVVKPPERGG